ncbi:aldehyde dehydrogenase [Pholiota conissans]|uniref:Aldehyde dehydrogenase n=1 Tax=Pholiota conissans TaxID=109636 RepID=A0A9P6CMS4_9AGAR|nr:aldehyde dehydrogenase [Pholiota conissans]
MSPPGALLFSVLLYGRLSRSTHPRSFSYLSWKRDSATMTHGYTPIDEIPVGLTKPIARRQHQLLQLAHFVKDNQEGFETAIHADLGKPLHEVLMGKITAVFERALICFCALKLSEIAPNYASFIAENLPKYLDKDAFCVALGGVPEITKILELKWDHIYYTGNGRVARIIATAAAKHLTPLILELGGESPVIVDATADIEHAAKRTLAGKTTNCAQICVTPDFVLVERSVASKFVEACAEVLKGFYPQGALNTQRYGRIVSEEHYGRLKGLLDRTKGRIVASGGARPEEKGIEPIVIADVNPGDSLLEGEIFGPFLPIVTVENVAGAIDYINDRDHPLVLYLFTTNESTKTKAMLQNTTSGNACINDTFTQLSINEMPFGGVGESGYGRQVQYYSYENFVYGRAEEPFHVLRYPPYTAESVAFFSQVMKTPIPESTNPAEVDVKN